MFTEVLKIVTKLDPKTLDQMEKQLSGRFTRVAKKFGKGLGNALKGGGLLGLAVGLIDKLLNPLKEVQESIDKMLGKSDDIGVYAKQFGTSSGNLQLMQAFAQANGLDSDAINMLIAKFQSSVAEAAADPTKQTSVRNYVGDRDTVASFFNFIQSLQKLGEKDINKQIQVQQEVFGEKQILKMSEFLNADFKQLVKDFSMFDAKKLTKANDKIAELADMDALFASRRGVEDTMNKASVMNKGMIFSRDAAARLELQRETERMGQYKNLQAIADTSTNIFRVLEAGMAQIGKFINFLTPTVNRLVTAIEKLGQSRIFKGIFGGKEN